MLNNFRNVMTLILILALVSVLCYTITGLLNIQNIVIYDSLTFNGSITWEVIFFFIFMFPISAMLDKFEILYY